MRRHRTTARGALLLILAALSAAAFVATPAVGAKGVPRIVFPLIGDFDVDDNYGDARANGSHAGIDIMNPRRTPVVAVEDGKIRWHTTSWRAGCMLYLYGASGTTYLYIHLNNDKGLTNDNKAGCVAGDTYTVKDGSTVTAGQQIAWNGDSGDADGNPHLHFEIHPNDGPDVNPYKYLVAAERLLFPGRVGAKFSVGLRGVPVSAGAGLLGVRVSSVRWWPGGRWTPIAERLVHVRIVKGATVASELASALASPEARQLSAARANAVSVFTRSAKITPDALRGEPGALVAARVTRPGATLVAAPSVSVPQDPVEDPDLLPEDPAAEDEGDGDYPPRPF